MLNMKIHNAIATEAENTFKIIKELTKLKNKTKHKEQQRIIDQQIKEAKEAWFVKVNPLFNEL